MHHAWLVVKIVLSIVEPNGLTYYLNTTMSQTILYFGKFNFIVPVIMACMYQFFIYSQLSL
jgi:hypothetical protein